MSEATPASRLELDLAALARAATGGDPVAIERLIRAAHGPLYRLLYFLGVLEADIDDVAQTTAIRLYRSIARYDADRPFLPWLRSIAQHVVANHRRARAREQANVGRFRDHLTELVRRRGLVESVQPRGDHLDDCIGRLAEKPRELVALCYFEGRTSEEIATIVARSPESIRQMLSRARGALKRCLEAKLPAAGT